METNSKVSRWLRGAGLALMLAMIVLAAFAAPRGTRAAGDNVVANGDFESGTDSWKCKTCNLTTGNPSQSGAAGQMTTTSKKGRAQLTQDGITLQPKTTYELKFWAQSSNGANLQVALLQQSKPFKNYGLKTKKLDVKTGWQEFTVTFKTKGFTNQVSDARLRFMADKGNGIVYSIDNVTLTATSGGGGGEPTPPPTGTGKEMLIYDWNKPITVAEGGFAMDKTSQFLKQNWLTPTNYADGRLYFRAEIKSIPKNQPDMKLGFCFWQPGQRENCKGNNVPGVPGTVSEWDFSPRDMWKKSGKEIDWATPRKKMGFSVRDGQNDPVSDKTSSNWGGNIPTEWYPMNIRFQVVLVPKGATFSGWQNYP